MPQPSAAELKQVRADIRELKGKVEGIEAQIAKADPGPERVQLRRQLASAMYVAAERGAAGRIGRLDLRHACGLVGAMRGFCLRACVPGAACCLCQFECCGGSLL